MSIVDNKFSDLKNILCIVKVKIQGKEREFHLNEDLTIDYYGIEFELDNFPQIYHLWGMIYSEVREQVSVAEKKIRRRKGMLFSEILLNEGKGMRRGDIADLVECDDELLKLDAEHIKLQKLAGKLYFTIESLKMKNDNMRSLCGFKKQEIK